ncbi:MAG: hypothetical protein HFH13_04385 [Dorea sp.]|nr:hypothetical protein [Dorea sp.]
MKKFELTSDFITNTFGVKLFRIKALVEFGNVKAGELGGYIEKEENLNQYGDAWVYGNAKVYGDAEVYGDAKVCGDAEVCGDAKVYGNAWVCGNAEVYGDAKVCGDAWVYGDAKVYGDAWVYGDAKVYGNADYVTVKGFGSVFRTTSFFREKNKSIGVKCGCFYGELDEFRDKVKETHGESKTAKEYLMLADLIEYKFSEEIAAERK